MKLIGLYGVARSGKDSVGGILAEHYGFSSYALADPIRRAASEMFGLPLTTFEGSNPHREEPDPFWGFSPREMLQKLGTEGGRDVFGEDIWVAHAERYWKTMEVDRRLEVETMATFLTAGLVVTDIRRDNEASFIKRNGGSVIEIKRPGTVAINEHVSEQGMHPAFVDFVIDNEGTLGDLRHKVNEILDIIDQESE